MDLREGVRVSGHWIQVYEKTYGCWLTDIQEIYGSHYELPELGPLGGSGLASPRDFESPLASFDIDQSSWESQCFRSDGINFY